MQPLRKVVHTAMFAGVALSEGARCAAPVRVQGTQDEGVRVRGMRAHDERARSALPASEGEAPVQSGAAEVLRQAPLQIHQLEFRQYAAASTYLKMGGLRCE